MAQQKYNPLLISGTLAAIGATAIWSGNFIVARGLNQSIPPVSLAFYRWLIAIIAILPFAAKPLMAEWGIIKKNLGYLSITSLLGITVFNTLIYFAGRTTTAINLSLISITFPIFIVILSRIFYNEPITRYKVMGIFLVAAGVILLITKGSPSKLFELSFAVGDVWMLCAAITFAVYSLLLKRRPRQLSIWAFQASTFILGIIFLFPFYVLEYRITPPVEFNTTIIGSILYVGVFASLSAFVLWNKAVENIGPSKAGILYYTLPLFSGIWATLFLNELICIIHFYSTVLIISGILTAGYKS